MRRFLASVWGMISGVLNLLVLLIFFSAFAAPYFRPESLWFGALAANFLPYLTLLLLIVVILSLRRRKKSWLLLNILALSLAIFRLWPAFATSADYEAETSDLTLYTQNIPRVPEDSLAQLAMYKAISADLPHIIAVQESGIYSTLKEPDEGKAQKKLKIVLDSLNYVTPPATRLDPSGRWFNTRQPILSSLQVIDQKETQFKKDELDIDPLFMTRTTFDWKGEKVAIYNIHLRTFGPAKPWHQGQKEDWFNWDFWTPFVSQVKEAYTYRSWQVDKVIAEIEKEDLPFVLLGDFNSSPYSWTHKQFSRGLVDVYQESTFGFGHTFHEGMPLVRIDYAFASDDWLPISASVGSSSRLISDHLPLIVRLRLKEN